MSLVEKVTILGKIPDAWEAVKLQDIFKIKSGDGLSKSNLIEGDYPVYGGNGVTFYHGDFNYNESKLIIGRVGAKCGCIHRTEKYSWITDNALIIDKSLREHNTFFLEYILNKIDLNQYANKNAQPVISGGKIYPLVIPFPSLPEQQKIAEILSTVDDKIEVIDQQINETQELKKGLMQRLLTKGIGHTEFKESALGMIPKSWDVVNIGDVLKLGSGKDYKHLGIGKIPVYGTGGIMTHVDGYLYDGESVGIGRKGTIDKPVFLKGKFWTVDTLFYSYNFNKITPYYTYILFQSIKWRRYSEATGVPSLSKNIIEPIKILLPPLKEQIKISNIFSSIDEKLEVLAEKKINYQELKQGLMQQLLTGRIRVKV